MRDLFSVLDGTETRPTWPSASRQISWGVLAAGVVTALSLPLLLNLLSVGVGASAISPISGDSPGTGLAINVGIWLILFALLPLWAGGWAAGHLIGPSNHRR